MRRYVLSSLSALALGLGSTVPTVAYGATTMAQAPAPATPASAPADLASTLSALEAAANSQDLDAVMGYYGESFSSDDGFDYPQLRQALETLWQQYGDLTYDIELLSWEANGAGGYIIETLTQVTGSRSAAERDLTLTAEVTSRQRLENGKIVSQDVLAETSRLVTGDSPPTLQVQVPETLQPGQTYSFDTIVLEPLENRALMGVAVDEGVTAVDFFTPRPVVFDVLSAGGLYKQGTAPAGPDQRWISAVIIREDGMVIETRRVQVAE
ncbi:MAG: nuclear transport factor 2 family protein [Nodosilinea sp.]